MNLLSCDHTAVLRHPDDRVVPAIEDVDVGAAAKRRIAGEVPRRDFGCRRGDVDGAIEELRREIPRVRGKEQRARRCRRVGAFVADVEREDAIRQRIADVKDASRHPVEDHARARDDVRIRGFRCVGADACDRRERAGRRQLVDSLLHVHLLNAAVGERRKEHGPDRQVGRFR